MAERILESCDDALPKTEGFEVIKKFFYITMENFIDNLLNASFLIGVRTCLIFTGSL
jgi:hypothetical protein